VQWDHEPRDRAERLPLLPWRRGPGRGGSFTLRFMESLVAHSPCAITAAMVYYAKLEVLEQSAASARRQPFRGCKHNALSLAGNVGPRGLCATPPAASQRCSDSSHNCLVTQLQQCPALAGSAPAAFPAPPVGFSLPANCLGFRLFASSDCRLSPAALLLQFDFLRCWLVVLQNTCASPLLVAPNSSRL